MPDKEKVIERIHEAIDMGVCVDLFMDVLAMMKEQEARIEKYEYLFHFLGVGFKEWTTKILNEEAEVICEADEHEHKTVITFKLI